MEYIVLCAMDCGLKVITTAMMDNCAIQMGGCHWNKLFFIPIESNMNTFRKPELYILKMLRYPKIMEIVLTTDILFCGEFGKLWYNFLATIDIIIRKSRYCKPYLGGALFICTMDHTQTGPIKDRPVLTSPHIITCFDMWCLYN